MRWWLLPFFVACGSAPSSAGDAGDDATVKDASSELGFAVDATPDVGVDAPDITLDGGGLFLCGSCACDGRTHYCYSASGGPSPMPLAGDAGDAAAACDDDAGTLPRCAPIPTSCPSPSCACLNPSPGVCTCSVDPTGNGLEVDCNFP